MLMKYAPFVVFTLVLSGCLDSTVALAPEAKSVTLVREGDRPLHCKALGRITGSSKSSDEKLAKAGAENDFRNHAADLKANFAVVESENGGPVGTSSKHNSFLGGEALLCQTEAMEDAEEKRAADEEAKKEQADADQEQQAADAKQAQADAKKKPKKK
ncbi:MAG: DUF4156 domain-containing protein [Pseudomonadota bacterium]